MKQTFHIKFTTILLLVASFGFSQEIKRMDKAKEAIGIYSGQYINAIASSKNALSADVAYKGKDSLMFLKDLKLFFESFEQSLRAEEGSSHFISNGKRLEYVLFVSNTGYTDYFYYGFEDGKSSASFVVALRTFITNYKWENPKRAKIMHRGTYLFK